MLRHSMNRSLHTVGLALLLTSCTKPAPTASPAANDDPPSTFIEAEPDQGDSAGLDRLSVAFPEGLLIDIHAQPLALGGGNWGFTLELEFYNRLANGGVLDLGPEPVVIFSISVTLPDGSGFGSGGGCAYGSSLHGSKQQALEPGKRYGSLQRWDAGVEAGQVLEVGVRLCHVLLPDGRSLSGDIAKLHAKVDARGELESFELAAIALPQPRP
jgi:hypothetical protein